MATTFSSRLRTLKSQAGGPGRSPPPMAPSNARSAETSAAVASGLAIDCCAVPATEDAVAGDAMAPKSIAPKSMGPESMGPDSGALAQCEKLSGTVETPYIEVTSEQPVPRARASDALERLRQLNRLRGVGPVSPTVRQTTDELSVLIDAEQQQPGLIYHRQRVDGATSGLDKLSLGHGAFLKAHNGICCDRILVVDTETTGLAGGTGTVPFLVGALAITATEVTLHQWLMTRFEGEAPMLEKLTDLVNEPGYANSLLVTYNGASFDVPLLETRARLAGLSLPVSAMEHLDVLHRVRRAYAGRWMDCRQQTAELNLLGHRRIDDIPGAEVPARWFDWMRRGNADGLVPVVEHNRLDLVGLARLLGPLAGTFSDPGECGARIVSTLRDRWSESQLYKYLQQHHDRLDATERLELARLAKRDRNYGLARRELEQLCRRGDLKAKEQLAKLCEHQLGELELALRLTRDLINESTFDNNAQVREARLLGKIAACAS
jgi:uncharacterized protein YprB with RNaseH-like and TPR domain